VDSSASPYLVGDDISVPGGQTLIIEAGVAVIFQGHYRMTVTGALLARGGSTNPILFTSADHDVGWYGLRIWDPAGPSGATVGEQFIEYCIFEYANKQAVNDVWYNDSRGALFIDTNSGSSLHVNNNLFRNNRSIGKGAGLTLGMVTGDWTMSGNVFENNRATDKGGALDVKHSTGKLTLTGGAFTGNSTQATTTQPNTASGAGGAIAVFNDSDVTLTDVIFTANTPDDWEGVVTVINHPPTRSPAAKVIWVSGYYVGY
jgi:hypothetical protein